MTELIGHIANVVLPIALCVLIGYGLAVLKLPFDRKLIGTLVQNVGYPTLVISHLSAGHVALSSFLVMAGAALVALAVFVAVSAVFLKLIGLPLRTFIAPLSLNNVGNIGLPVAALAFGDAGLSYSFAFMIVVLLGIFTYGTWVPHGSVNVRDVLTSPVIYALAVALLLLGLHLHLPKPLASAFGILGGLAIPLMLLTLGHTLATLKLSAIGRGALLAGFHLVMAAANGFRAHRSVRLLRHRARHFHPHVPDAGVRGHVPVRRTLHAGACPGRREPDSGLNTADRSGAAGRVDLCAVARWR
jgi:predicted permease